MPLISFLFRANRCRGMEISMNFGFSGPMNGRRADTANVRDENEGVEHFDMELNKFLVN
jgi:hypothetical protein